MKKKIIVQLVFGLFILTESFAFNAGAVDIHGFISQGYMKSDEYDYFVGMKDGSFQINELGLNFSNKLTKRLRLGVQFFARDLGNIGNDEIVVDWAYADYYFWEWLGLRAGRMKAPLGLYNESRDVDAVRTGVFLPQSVYFDILRDSLLATNGICMYGDIGMGVAGSLSYQFQAGANNVTNDSGTAQGVIALGGISEITSIEANQSLSGRVKWLTPLSGLTLSVSNISLDMEIEGETDFTVPFALEYKPFATTVYSMEYIWNDLVITTEYERMTIDYDLFVPAISYRESGREKLLGWYSGVAYRFYDWFEGGVAYSEFYDKADDRDGSASDRLKYQAFQKEIIFSLRFDINPNWIVKFEDHYIDGNNQVMIQYDDSYDVRRWNLWLAKVTFMF